MSAVPPAVNPTSQRIGPDGQVCAVAMPALASEAHNASTTRQTRFIVPSPLFGSILADFRWDNYTGLDLGASIGRVQRSNAKAAHARRHSVQQDIRPRTR